MTIITYIRLMIGRFNSWSNSRYLEIIASWKTNETWSYQPPVKNDIAWIFVQSGKVNISEEIISKELVVFEESNGELHFTAVTDCSFLLGIAQKHEHALVLGSYSVHTNLHALNIGEEKITEIGVSLKSLGKI